MSGSGASPPGRRRDRFASRSHSSPSRRRRNQTVTKGEPGGGGRERLTSAAINEAIRPCNPQGAFGARHWPKRFDVCET